MHLTNAVAHQKPFVTRLIVERWTLLVFETLSDAGAGGGRLQTLPAIS